MTAATDRDVVLVTVDCWRYDALEWMPALRDRLQRDGYARGQMIAQAPSTRGAIPAILASQYYPQVYRGFDDVAPDVETLATVLADDGYATGGFVASNPYATSWKRGFDRFWNDGLDVEHGSPLQERLRSVTATARHAANYARMRGRVPAEDIARRAREWYDGREGPRFLWMHLMDAHVPYLPGWRRGAAVGPLSLYLSHWRFSQDPNGISDDDRQLLRECYRESLASLDAQFERVLDFVDDDAVIVLTGDHGEEFDHGDVGHARLYDETVRTPLLAKGLSGVDDGDVVRQLDIPATVLDRLDRSVPDGWEGSPHDGTFRDAFMLNHSPRLGRVYAGLRTERRKLIRTADADSGEVLDWEAYDLEADPGERTDIRSDGDVRDLEHRLRDFLSRDDIADGILEQPREGTSVVVENRLEALGYK